MGEGSILDVAICFINNNKGLAPSPVYMEYTRSLQEVTITVFSMNHVHELPVQSHYSPCRLLVDS
jgi:hypothetical protein